MTTNKYPDINIYNGQGTLGDTFIEMIEYLGNNQWHFIRDGGVDDNGLKLIQEEKYETHQLYNELYNLDGEDETDERIKEFKTYISDHLESSKEIIFPLLKKLYPSVKVGLNKDEVSFILSELDNDVDIIDIELETIINIFENKRKEKLKGWRSSYGVPKTKYDSILGQLRTMKLLGERLFIE